MLDKVRQENARKEAEIKKMEDKILNLRTEIKSSCDTIKVSMMEQFQSCRTRLTPGGLLTREPNMLWF